MAATRARRTLPRKSFDLKSNVGWECAEQPNVVEGMDQEVLNALNMNNALMEQLIQKLSELIDGPCPSCDVKTEEPDQTPDEEVK